MPTSNISFRLPLEPKEHMQWTEIAEEENQSLTHFIREAVREKIAKMGYTPSTYDYASGQKKDKQAP